MNSAKSLALGSAPLHRETVFWARRDLARYLRDLQLGHLRQPELGACAIADNDVDLARGEHSEPFRPGYATHRHEPKRRQQQQASDRATIRRFLAAQKARQAPRGCSRRRKTALVRRRAAAETVCRIDDMSV